MPKLDDALAYARLNIPIFPLNGKQPIEKPGVENIDGLVIEKGNAGFHQATIDQDKIARWWLAYPDANMGTPTGRHLDPITSQPNALPFDVLDIDTDHGGLESIKALLKANEPLPETPNQITGSGGFHYLFVSDGSIRNSAGGIAPGIDIRGTGGYIVIAPSIHPDTLEPYEWSTAPWDLPIAPMPVWLRETIREVSRKRATAQPGQRIPIGIQEATLTRIAGAMRRHSATEGEILAAITVISQERCDPPLKEESLLRIAASVSNYSQGDNLLDFRLDDGGNAERLVYRYGEVIRHVADARAGDGWYCFDGRVWKEGTSKVVQYQLETARAYQDAADAIHVPEGDDVAKGVKKAHKANAKHCAQDRGLMPARKLAGSFPEIELPRTELDPDPWSFAVANGIIDLKTGDLRQHHSADLITRMSPVSYDPTAVSELWDHFLDWLTRGRADLKLFLQMAAGYSLTADTREEKLFFLHGPARSGKTTFIEALKAVMGAYALTADFSTFLKGHNVGGARSDIARLAGARFVSSVEVDQGKAMAEGLVKQMTGGDTITARFQYASEFEYNATHKLWLVANDAPKVNDEDDGLWRRILRIPCDNVVPEQDQDTSLKPRLKDPMTHGPGILTWMVQGCLTWQEAGGLYVPETIRAATQDYRESQDPITDFLLEACQISPEYKVAFGDLWGAYLGYCQQYKRKPMGRTKFSNRLEARGFTRAREGKEGTRMITGLTLAVSDFS